MKEKSKYLEVKDYAVSGESFKLLYDASLDLLTTTPRPSKDRLQDYYKSDDYISHTDRRKNLFERVYHFVRSISLKHKMNLINSFNFTERKLLDVGCGTGDFLLAAKKHEWYITGIEPNANARSIANKKTNGKVQNINTLFNFEQGSFNVITLWHVLEHLPELDENISTLRKLLKDDGRLVIAVPNYKSFDAQYYKQHWAAYDAPRHLWHFSQTAISRLFAKENLEIEKILPMKFDAYYVSLLSEKYKSGWMNFFNAFFVASRSNLKASKSGEYSSLIYVLKKS